MTTFTRKFTRTAVLLKEFVACRAVLTLLPLPHSPLPALLPPSIPCMHLVKCWVPSRPKYTSLHSGPAGPGFSTRLFLSVSLTRFFGVSLPAILKRGTAINTASRIQLSNPPPPSSERQLCPECGTGCVPAHFTRIREGLLSGFRHVIARGSLCCHPPNRSAARSD